MKGERHLKLVPLPPEGSPGAPAFDAGEDEPPPTEAELREAQALERALDKGIDPLAAALRSAYRPDPLEDVDHEALLARALGDEGAPPTAAERRDAERLAGELDAMKGRRAAPEPLSEPAEIAAALRAAWAPRSIEPLRNEALIAKALATSKRRRALPVTMAALSSLAAVAAGVALFFGQAKQPEQSAPTAAAPTAAGPAQAALIRARSTSDLFDPETPFPRSGGTSERMDRIVSARSADLRANRFAAWGVP
ncbi:MAG TPA: hypothetical protein VE093_45435 [Polyangiaceae bacterium]|nr:hypothetical protein [Polyangiaceae bacterium]